MFIDFKPEANPGEFPTAETRNEFGISRFRMVLSSILLMFCVLMFEELLSESNELVEDNIPFRLILIR